jgi:hypothetical protein
MHGPRLRGEHGVEGRRTDEERAQGDVLDDDSLTRGQCRAASGIAVEGHGVEKSQEWRRKTSTRRDLQAAGPLIEQLDIAHVGLGEIDGGIDHVLQKGTEIPRQPEAQADVIDPPVIGAVACKTRTRAVGHFYSD